MTNSIYKKTIRGVKFIFTTLPGTGVFHFEIHNNKGSNVERLYNKMFKKNVFGISHLIEHLSFKTTKDYSSQEIFHKLKNIGQFNAHTAYDEIVYYCTTVTAQTEDVISLISNIAFNDLSKINQDYETYQKDFLIEKDVVLNEFRQMQDDTQDMFLTEAQALVFGYKKDDNIIGTFDSISGLTYEDCVAVKKMFLNKNDHTYLIGFDPEEIEEQAIVDLVLKQLNRFNLDQEFNEELQKDYQDMLGTVASGSKKIKSFSEQSFLLCFIKNKPEHYFLAGICNSYLQYKSPTSLLNYIREERGLSYSVAFEDTERDLLPYSMFFCDVEPENLNLTFKLFKKSIIDSCDLFNETLFENFIKSEEIELTLKLTNSLVFLDYARDFLKTDVYSFYDFKTNARTAAREMLSDILYENMMEYLHFMKESVNTNNFKKISC